MSFSLPKNLNLKSESCFLIGKGSYGRVYLVESRGEENFKMALKIVDLPIPSNAHNAFGVRKVMFNLIYIYINE